MSIGLLAWALTLKSDRNSAQAQAEADQARAAADAANAKLDIAADCAKAYVSAFGMLFEGEDVEEQAPAVREQFASILRSPPTAPLSHDPARFRFPAWEADAPRATGPRLAK